MFAFCATLLALAPSALATTYRPDRTGDNPVGGLTLREAITLANNHPGADEVIVKGGKTYRLSVAGIDDLNASGDLDIRDSSVTIKSNSKKLATVTAQGIDRVFDVVNADASGKFVRLIVRGGVAAGDGGGISAFDGGVTVSRSVISGNSATDEGGGISTDSGSVSISKSTIKNNVGDAEGDGDGDGGGIFTLGSEFVRIKSSTISGNTTSSTGGGGGISDQSDSLSLVNSTIANNSATSAMGVGGGILSDGPLVSINAVTIGRNSAGAEGGGFARSGAGSFTARNSLIARNAAPDGADCTDFGGTVTSFGQNLVGNNTSCTSFSAASGDLVNRPPAQIKIGRLADNGGLTKTIALKRGSRAVNKAGSDSPTRDQRGRKRRNPDIGAFERT